MKKRLSLLGALLCAGVLSVPASAASPYYISGNAGISSFSEIKPRDSVTGVQHGTITTHPGIDLAGAFGRSFGNFRVEAEAGYQRNNCDKMTIPHVGVFDLTGNFSVTSLMANGYYDFKTGAITPYLTAGLGLAEVTVNKVPDPPTIIDERHSVLGYQVGAGVAVPVSKCVSIDARYRYSGTSTVTLSGTHGKIEIPGSGFLAGLRVGI
jgi:opacity protein-like surface antigen